MHLCKNAWNIHNMQRYIYGNIKNISCNVLVGKANFCLSFFPQIMFRKICLDITNTGF